SPGSAFARKMAPVAVRRPLLAAAGLAVVSYCILHGCSSAFAALHATADAATSTLVMGAWSAEASPGPSFGAPSLRRGQPFVSRIPMQAAGETGGFSLEGKVALVTGASRGIGAAIAAKLAKAGATVIGTATSDSGASAITGRFGGDLKGEGMKLDVTDNANVEEVMKAIEAKYGGCDILVNNAGITKDTLMMRMKEDQWNDVIDTNLNSVFRIAKAGTKGMMKKRWGRIISISSVVSSMGNAGQANYAAAK
ncbi:unnamed protein product, partial [Polarella glacialis]